VAHRIDPQAKAVRRLADSVRIRSRRDTWEQSNGKRTFRKWLTERGCRFDRHEHEKRGEGQVIVTVHREGRRAEVPLGGSRRILDARVVRQACEELGVDWSQLPRPKGRV